MNFSGEERVNKRRRVELQHEIQNEDGITPATLSIVNVEHDPPPAESSFFQSSSNIAVNGGQFSSVGGPHASVIINLHQGAIDDRTTNRSVAMQKSSHPTSFVNAENPHEPLSREADRRAPAQDLPLPIQKSCDIYYRHLAVKDLGYPLWIPEPNDRLPTQYQIKGVSIGDVGIITPSGSFDFLFNICSLPNDPINPRELPENFSPIHPPLDHIDTLRCREFKSNNYLASASIKRTQREDGDSSGLTFESSASEGAVLIMPHGAHSEVLGNITRFRRYLAANAEYWYKYVNGIRGREAQNGDIRLVIGCHKTTAWGIAAFSNLTESTNFRLRFRPTGDGDVGLRTYTWEYSGMAEARTGPSTEEIVDLRNAHGEPDSTTDYKNQCLFIRTLNVTLREDIWRRLNSELNTEFLDIDDADDVLHRSVYSKPDISSNFSRNHSDDSSSGSRSNLNNNNFSLDVKQSNARSSTEPVHISELPRSRTNHPSKAINEMLLRKKPNARMAITEDQDWISLLREDDLVLPEAEQLCSRFKAYDNIQEEDGVIFVSPDQAVTPVGRLTETLTTMDPQTQVYFSSPLSHFTSNTKEVIAITAKDNEGSDSDDSRAGLAELARDAKFGDHLNTSNNVKSEAVPQNYRADELESSKNLIEARSRFHVSPSPSQSDSDWADFFNDPPDEQVSNNAGLVFGSNYFHDSVMNMLSPYTATLGTPSSLPQLSYSPSSYLSSPRLATPSSGDLIQSLPGSSLLVDNSDSMFALEPQASTGHVRYSTEVINNYGAQSEKPRFTHREQLQKFRDVLNLPMDGGGPFVPQQMYKPHTTSDRKRYVEEVLLEGPLYFICEPLQKYGIALKDALHSRTKTLRDRDQAVFEGRRPSVAIRLEWPGYRQWSRQIPTKDFRSPPQPITLAKLAKHVAKCVQRFIQDRKALPLEEDADSRWRIGDGPDDIKLEDIILVSIHHVSLGSWQPHLRLARPLRPRHTDAVAMEPTPVTASTPSPSISLLS